MCLLRMWEKLAFLRGTSSWKSPQGMSDEGCTTYQQGQLLGDGHTKRFSHDCIQEVLVSAQILCHQPPEIACDLCYSLCCICLNRQVVANRSGWLSTTTPSSRHHDSPQPPADHTDAEIAQEWSVYLFMQMNVCFNGSCWLKVKWLDQNKSWLLLFFNISKKYFIHASLNLFKLLNLIFPNRVCKPVFV